MIDKMNQIQYNDPCKIALSYEQQYRDTLDWVDVKSFPQVAENFYTFPQVFPQIKNT